MAEYRLDLTRTAMEIGYIQQMLLYMNMNSVNHVEKTDNREMDTTRIIRPRIIRPRIITVLADLSHLEVIMEMFRGTEVLSLQETAITATLPDIRQVMEVTEIHRAEDMPHHPAVMEPRQA